MQRSWVLAVIVGSGVLAQTPPYEPPPAPVLAPVQAPEPKPAEVKAEAPAQRVEAPKTFDQLRPTQRKMAYTLHRAALASHELGYYRSHPRAVEVREVLEALVQTKATLPEKAQTAIPGVEAYLVRLRANHGLYDGDGKKILLEGTWKDLQASTRAAAKLGAPGLEARLLKVKGLLMDPKVDAVAPTWPEPEAPAVGKKGKKAKVAKGPKVLEGLAAQKAITALWVKRAQAWIENTRQEVEIKGEKKVRRMADPGQTKALNALLIWLENEDLDLLRDPGFGWMDLRRLGAEPGMGLLAHASDIAAGKAPEGAVGELPLLPVLEPILGDSKLSKGDEKRGVLMEVKQGPPAVDLAAQMAAFEKQGRSREIEVK